MYHLMKENIKKVIQENVEGTEVGGKVGDNSHYIFMCSYQVAVAYLKASRKGLHSQSKLFFLGHLIGKKFAKVLIFFLQKTSVAGILRDL